MTFDLASYLGEQTELINAELDRLLPKVKQQPQRLHAAMRYSVLAGGKRLRPNLVLAAAQAINGSILLREQILPAACALECLHTYSLIHDDLPAMDDDDLRRGKATNHRVFGQGMAILAGDALLTLAFEILTNLKGHEASAILAVIAEMAEAAGSLGMVGGQAVDIMWEQSQDCQGEPADALAYIHFHKTAALLIACVRIGALLAGAQPQQLAMLTKYAEAIGHAFQITDDLLDVYGDGDKLGKEVGRDAALGKLTYPAVHGLVKSEKQVKYLLEQALASLANFGPEANALRALAILVTTRES